MIWLINYYYYTLINIAKNHKKKHIKKTWKNKKE